MDFQTIPPAELRAAWPRVRGWVEQVAALGDGWIPEDVYHEARSGRAAVHIGDDALLVTVAKHREYTGEPELFVWIAFNAGTPDDFGPGLDWLREHARQFGFTAITFASPRPGWRKRARPTKTFYRIEVTP